MSDIDLIEMNGVFVAWDGKSGTIHADGVYVTVHQSTLRKFKRPLKLGDRIDFTARRSTTVSYTIDKVRLMVPQEPRSSDALAYKAWQGRDDFAVETREGTVESFDEKKGLGFIDCSDGERALLHITVLRAAGITEAVLVGSHISFEALRRPTGIQAFRILKIRAP